MIFLKKTKQNKKLEQANALQWRVTLASQSLLAACDGEGAAKIAALQERCTKAERALSLAYPPTKKDWKRKHFQFSIIFRKTKKISLL